MPVGPHRPRLLLAVAVTVLALVISGTLGSVSLRGEETPLDRVEAALLDLRHLLMGARAPPPALVIVALDDRTVAEAGAYPLPRSTLARLIRVIARNRPSAIGLDILLLQPGPADQDEDLASALRDAHVVIGAAALFPQTADGADRTSADALPRADGLLWPTDRLASAAGGVGLVNVAADDNGTPRHVPLLVQSSEGPLPAFALQVAARAAQASPAFSIDGVTIGRSTSALDLGRSLVLRLYGPRGTIPTISAAALLRGDPVAASLADHAVVIGATATGTGDTFATPFDPVLPGVEVVSTAIGNLLSGGGLVRDHRTRLVDAGAAIALAVATALLLSFAPPALGTALTFLLIGAWLAATVAAFANGWWLNATMPVAATIPVMPVAVAWRQILERREMARIGRSARSLQAFQSPRLAARIATDPNFLAESRTQMAGVIFIDLGGFTRFSEAVDAREVELFLKAFHGFVAQSIDERAGVVLNFMGDGALGVFGLPEPQADDASRAFETAMALVPAVRDWLQDQQGDGLQVLDVRVGAHWGAVVVTRLGGPSHQQITAAGDTVNVASRLMEVGKQSGAALVVSDALVAASGAKARLGTTLSAPQTVALRGRTQPLVVRYGFAADEPRQGGGSRERSE